MRVVAAAVAALLAQRLLGLPPLPPWSAALLMPMVLLVAPAIHYHQRPGRWWAVVLGLAWDVVMEPVVGPGGIAWSATAIAIATAATVVANRSVAAWAGFGAIGATTFLIVHWLALLPLGVAPALGARRLVVSVALTGAWCGAVGWLESLDLPARWRRWRSRRLR